MPWPDLLIAGGGVVGAACARSLARRGVRVTVVEPGPLDGAATPASAGMLAPFAEATRDDPMLGFAIRARDLYDELAPELLEETGIDIGLWREGVLQVALTPDDVTRLRETTAWQRQQGFAVEWLDAEEVRDRLPGIAPDCAGAAVALEDGALEPTRLRDALLQSAARSGATIVANERVTRLVVEDGRVAGVDTNATHHPAGAVLVAAGCWSGTLAGLPRPLSVEPIRGQMAALEWPQDEPPAIVFGGGGYVVQRGGEALAGSTMEHAGFLAAVTTEGLRRVFTAMHRLYPALDEGKVRRTWAGLRPGTPDGHPILGPDPEVEGLWYATGHGRNGILLAAMSGELIADLYTGTPVEHDLSPIAPSRFWRR
jgi:glycine oxidase